jgi:hypothetical protein
MRRLLLILSMSFFLLSAMYLFLSSPLADDHYGMVLSIPIQFVKGATFSQHFTVDTENPYESSLLFHPQSSWQTLDSIFHDRFSMNTRMPIILSLWQNDTLILSMDTVESLGFDQTDSSYARTLVPFRVAPGNRYRVMLGTKVSIPELNAMNPTFEIRLSHQKLKQQAVSRQVNFVIAKLLVAISLIFLLLLLTLSILRRQRDRRRLNSH